MLDARLALRRGDAAKALGMATDVARSADAPAGCLKGGLVTLGQWSLSYYLLHQPVLMGLVGAFVWLSTG